jgi:hypothetical protein
MSPLVKKSIFPVLLKCLVIWAFIMSILLLFFYAAGTRQGFTDRTQLRLLHLSLLTGVFLALVAVYGVLYNLYHLLKNKKFRSLFLTALCLLLGIYGAALAVFASFIRAAAGGNV